MNPKIQAMREEILKGLPCEELTAEEIAALDPDNKNPKNTTNMMPISVNAQKLLLTIARSPNQAGLVDLYRAAGLGGGGGNRAREELEKKHMVKFQKMPSRGHGPSRLLPCLTDAGWNVAEKHGIKRPKTEGSGSPGHRVGQDTLRLHCEKAYPGAVVRVEAWLEGTFVDVLAEMPDGTRIAYEIALSMPHQYENVVRDLARGCSEVVVVCLDGELRSRLKDQVLPLLDPELTPHVSFRVLKEFMT